MTAKGPLYAVMANATRRKSQWSIRNKENPAAYIPVHLPTFFTKLTPTANGRVPDEVYRQWNLWHPHRERLEFWFDDDGTPGELEYNTTRERRADNTLQHIRHVPDMRLIRSDRAKLKPEFLSDEVPVSPRIVSQIFVPRGRVSSGGIRNKGAGVDVHFVTDQRRVDRNPATIVPNVVVTVDVEKVTVRAFSLDSDEELDPLEFVLDGDAEIRIANGDPSDMITNQQRLADAAYDMRRGGALSEGGSLESLFRVNDPAGRELIDRITERVDLSRFIAKATSSGFDDHAPVFARDTSGGDITEEPLTVDPNLRREVDLDFELFYDLLEGDDDRLFPIPKITKDTFPERNCFTCLVGCECVPKLKSVK